MNVHTRSVGGSLTYYRPTLDRVEESGEEGS